MSGLERSTATLRLFGDDLEPTSITDAMGCAPSRSTQKGDVKVGRATGQKIVARTGCWLLKAESDGADSLDRLINEVLARVTQDPEIWRDLSERFCCDIFCGLFMSTSNDGLDLNNQTLAKLSARNLGLRFDIYANETSERETL